MLPLREPRTQPRYALGPVHSQIAQAERSQLDLGRAATVVDLLDEEVLEMPDGKVKPLIVRVVRPREVLPLPPMWLKKSAP